MSTFIIDKWDPELNDHVTVGQSGQQYEFNKLP